MKDCALAVIFNSSRDKVLILLRRDIPLWVLPGGGIEKGETPEIAAIREVLEETGLKVSIVRKIAEYSPLNRLASMTHIFECQLVNGELFPNAEAKAIDYFPLNQLPKDFFFLHKVWLEDALAENAFVIKKPISQVTYINLLKYFFKRPMLVLKSIISRLGFPINSK